jgi:putative ABC transport system permease protein
MRMGILRAWLLRLSGLFGNRQRDREFAEEMESHLQMHIDDNLRAGMTPEEARRQALLKLGGVEQTKESYRDRRGIPWLERLLQNVRFGLRMLHKDPGLTAVVVLTLALGIGANTAIFTVAYATLLAPLPYPQADELVNVWSNLQGHRISVSAGDFLDWKRQSTTFEDLNACGTDDFNIATKDRPEFFDGMEATPGYYGMLGNPLFLGRNFLPEEGQPGKEHVVILTYRLWRHLGANPKMIGQTMQINGEPYTVVGVFAPGAADRWNWELIVPLVFNSEQLNHDSRYWLVTGRLRPGVTIKQAQAEMDSVTAKEAMDYPKSDQGWGALVEPFRNDFFSSDRKLTLWLLLGAVGFLLLIACLNVANLLLAKGIARQREVAIRGSLGATPVAIFAQFLTESLVLAILGALLGIAAGYAMLQGLVAVMPPQTLPAEADLRLNVPVLLFMLAATTLAGVLFGCVPAWYASRSDLSEILKEGGRAGIGVSRHRLRRLLVTAEFALALPLLTGAGLAIHSFWNLTHVDLGVRTDHILGFYLDSPSLLKDPKQINTNSYYRRILASIETVPGVSHASAMSYLPLDSLQAETLFSVAGKSAYSNPSLRPSADLEMVTPDYFQTFGIRIVKGRAFTDADNASSVRVAMVNETFAKRFLNGVDPLEQRLMMEQVVAGPQNGPPVEWQIVGVFHTVKSRGAREDNPEIDVSFWQEAFPVSGIGVRTADDPATIIKSVAAAVNAADSQAALYKPRTMEQVHDEVLANDQFTAILFAGFAAIGLLLAAVGIHGVTAFSVAQRSHEIALRIALGATRNRVVALVMKEGLMLAFIGLGFGLIGAYFVERAMRSTLFGVGSIDFSTLVAMALGLLFAALLACYLPARRATRVDPMVALRCE